MLGTKGVAGAARKHQLAAIIAEAFGSKPTEDSEDVVFSIQQALEKDEDDRAIDETRLSLQQLCSRGSKETDVAAEIPTLKDDEEDKMPTPPAADIDGEDPLLEGYTMEELEELRQSVLQEQPAASSSIETTPHRARPKVETQPLNADALADDPTCRVLPKRSPSRIEYQPAPPTSPPPRSMQAREVLLLPVELAEGKRELRWKCDVCSTDNRIPDWVHRHTSADSPLKSRLYARTISVVPESEADLLKCEVCESSPSKNCSH